MVENKKRILIIISVAIIGIGLITGIVFSAMQNISEAEQQEIDDLVTSEMTTYSDNYPIIDNLPIITSNYRIDYGICEQSDGDFCLMISARKGYTEYALSALREIDSFEDGKYEIEYSNYVNAD